MRSSVWSLCILVLLRPPGLPAETHPGWPAPEDLEASGDDLEMEGSGSGAEEILDEKSTLLGSSSANKDKLEHEQEPWNREHIVIQESRSFMENKEVFTGVVAGGVGGLVLAVLLGALLIYKWQRKEAPGGYVEGHNQESQEPHTGLRGSLWGHSQEPHTGLRRSLWGHSQEPHTGLRESLWGHSQESHTGLREPQQAQDVVLV